MSPRADRRSRGEAPRRRREGPSRAGGRSAALGDLGAAGRAAGAAPPPACLAVLPGTWLLALAAFAFAVRALVAVQLHESPLLAEPQLDSFEFLTWARQLLAGEWLRWPGTSHGPGYPFFLAALLRLGGGSLLAVSVLQGALGALLCALVASLAARLLDDRRAGVAAGCLVAVYGPLVYVEASLFAEGLFVFLLLAGLWLLTLPGAGGRTAVAAGAVWGLAAVTRATALPLVPFAALLVAAGRTPLPRRSAPWLLVAWLAVVAPVLGIVRAQTGSWLPVQSFGGLNLYLGNRAGASGTPDARLGGSWDLLFHAPERHGVQGEAARERWFARAALADVTRDPGAALAGLGRKAVWLLQAAEVRDMVAFFRAQAPALGWLPGFGLLLPLAAWGAWLARRRLPAVVWGYLALFALSNVALVVSARYRLPLVPVLAIPAGAAAVWLRDRLQRPRWRELVPAAAVLAAVTVVAQLREHTPSLTFSEEWALTAVALQRQGRLDAAERAVERALAVDPDAAAAWLQQASLLSRRGDAAGTEEALRRAVAAGPDYLQARLALGALLARRGELPGAVEQLQHARWVAPDDPRALTELGGALLALGRTEEARGVYEQLVAWQPRHTDGLLALARLAGAERRPLAGARLAARAAEVDPRRGDAWLLLAMLAIDGGDRAQAETALARAESLLGGEAPQVVLARSLLDQRLRGVAGA